MVLWLFRFKSVAIIQTAVKRRTQSTVHWKFHADGLLFNVQCALQKIFKRMHILDCHYNQHLPRIDLSTVCTGEQAGTFSSVVTGYAVARWWPACQVCLWCYRKTFNYSKQYSKQSSKQYATTKQQNETDYVGISHVASKERRHYNRCYDTGA